MDLTRKLGMLSGAGLAGLGRDALARPSEDALGGDESPEAERRVRITRLRGLIAQMEAGHRRELPRRTPGATEHSLPGAVRETLHGPIHVVERVLEPHHCHGRVPIARMLDADPACVASLALDPSLEHVDLERALFLDTETTGLSGGTGTLPFLVGLGWFENESLVLEQLLLRRPGEEAPILRHVAERLASASCLVTYNGKSFDWPLLRTRFILNRVPTPLPAAHIDLLHCARRVYKRRLGDVRLVNIETEVLGLRRDGDVDGSLIPGIYLSYLRSGEGGELAPVIEHNAKDIIALAAVLAILAERFATVNVADDARDHLGLAEVAARADDEERALAFARAAADGGGDDDVTCAALELAALLARRRRDPHAAARDLEAALVVAGPAHARTSSLHLALAKLAEHGLRDPARAISHARECAGAEGEAGASRRMSRLERKLARATARAPLFAGVSGPTGS